MMAENRHGRRAAAKVHKTKIRELPITPEIAAGFERQRAAFRRKFGRDPGPDDPVFFDPSSETPAFIDQEKFRAEMIANMVKAEIPGELIYAYAETGLIVTKAGYHNLSRRDRKAYNDAIDAYFDMTDGLVA